jgi:1-phosphatidylinositol-3-phosphate 5-kinase
VEDACSTTNDKMDDESDANNSYDYHATSSMYADSISNIYDFLNNIALWSPPDPEDGEEEEEEYGEEDEELNELPDGLTGSWKRLIPSSSFKSFGSSDPMGDQTEVLKHAAGDHFRLLLEQLLQIEDIPIEDGESQRNWVEIVQELAQEVAEFVRPDQTGSGSIMDPVGFVKIKCIASGDKNERLV